ncbi:MAG: VOC family protein [Planctomycetes bacterium]|nr:VOC family protein [Planctomycetota bacterium]
MPATKKSPSTSSATSAAGPWNGRFVWHDLMTKDGAAAQEFYCALFGWQIQPIDMGGCIYRMIVAGPGPIGGIVEEKNIPTAHWMPYLATADVDAAAANVTQLGGSTCVPPTDIPNTGRFAVVGDPQGAFFSLYKGLPTSHGADPDAPVAGRVCWNELLTTDADGALRFYATMFGWTDEPKDIGEMGTYHVQNLGTKQAGGIMKNPQPGMPSAWLVYFLAPDLHATTERAKQLRATPLMENVPIPGVGAFSMFVDPTGAVFALFQPLPQHVAKEHPELTVVKEKPAKTKSAKKAKPAKAAKKPAQAPKKAAARKAKKAVAKAGNKKPVKAAKKAPKKPAAKKAPAKAAKKAAKKGAKKKR